jgi:hypothetical protein
MGRDGRFVVMGLQGLLSIRVYYIGNGVWW